MEETTHTISVKVHGTYLHGTDEDASVSLRGDGSLDHFLMAFQAALVAAGFHASTASRLNVRDEK